MSTSIARKQRREAEKNTEGQPAKNKPEKREGLFMDPVAWMEFMNENIPPNLQKKIIAYMNINCPKITATFTQSEKE